MVKEKTTELLNTLASKGDSTVRLLILTFVIMNGIQGWKTGQTVDKTKDETAKEIELIYRNQKVIAAYWMHASKEHDLIMQHLGIPQPDETPRPELSKLPQFEFDKPKEGNQK